MYYRWIIAWSCCHLIHILARPPRRFMQKGSGDREGSNFPSPVPFNPRSRPIFLASPLFAFFRFHISPDSLLPYTSRPHFFRAPGHLSPSDISLASRLPYTSHCLFSRVPGHLSPSDISPASRLPYTSHPLFSRAPSTCPPPLRWLERLCCISGTHLIY